MAFGQELKDFINAYKATSDIGYQNARRDVYRQQAEAARLMNEAYTGGGNNAPARPPQVEGVGGGGGGSPVSTEEQRKFAEEGVQHFTKAGESPIVAAGIVGNAWAESNLNPTIPGDNGASFGLYQFHQRGRQPIFNKWVADNQRNRDDRATQHDFVLYDLKTNFPDTYKRMQAAKSPEQSAEIFMREYERPRADVARLGHRQAYAKQAFGLYDASGGMRNPAAIPARSYSTGQTGPSVYPVSGASPATRPRRDRVALEEELMYEQTAAQGGMIEAVPAFNEGGFAPTLASAEDAQGRGNDDIGTAGYGGGDRTILGAALDGGLKFLQRTFGLNERSAVDAPGRQNDGLFSFLRGDGAASPEEYDSVMARIDPNGVLTTAQRNIRGLENVYQFYMARGEQEKADRAAASLIQYSSNMAAKYAALSVQAGRSGDLKKMTEYASKAYDYTPDGSTADGQVTSDGKIAITQRDAETNKPIRQFTVTPQELLSSALGMTTKNEYWNRISEAAERHMGTKPTVAAQRQQQRQAAIDDFYNTPDDDGAVKPASQEQPQQEPRPEQRTQPAAIDVPAVDTAPATTTPQVEAPQSTTTPAQAGPDADGGDGGDETAAKSQGGTTPGGAPAPRAAAPQRPTVTPYQDIVPRPQMSEEKRAKLAKVAAVDPNAAKALMAEWEKTVLNPWKEAERRYYEQANKFAADELNNQRTNQRTQFQESQANKRTEFQEKQQTERMQQQEKLQMQRQKFIEEQTMLRDQLRIAAEERTRLANRTPAQVEADNMEKVLPDKAARAVGGFAIPEERGTGREISMEGITSDGQIASPTGGTVTEEEVKSLDQFRKNPVITALTKELAQIRSLREDVRTNNTQGRDDVDKSLDAAIGVAFTVPNPKSVPAPAPLTAEQKGAAKAIAYQIMRYNDVTPEDAMKMTASLLFVNPEYDTRSGPATTYDITDQGRVRLKSTGEEIIMPKNAITGVDLYRKAELNGVFQKRTERNAAESKRISDAMRAADEAETYRRGKAAAAMGPYDNRGAIPVEAPPLFDPTMRGKKPNAPKAKDFQSLWD